jgi:hypothetical protein
VVSIVGMKKVILLSQSRMILREMSLEGDKNKLSLRDDEEIRTLSEQASQSRANVLHVDNLKTFDFNFGRKNTFTQDFPIASRKSKSLSLQTKQDDRQPHYPCSKRTMLLVVKK